MVLKPKWKSFVNLKNILLILFADYVCLFKPKILFSFLVVLIINEDNLTRILSMEEFCEDDYIFYATIIINFTLVVEEDNNILVD
jgi:hypothetical protein